MCKKYWNVKHNCTQEGGPFPKLHMKKLRKEDPLTVLYLLDWGDMNKWAPTEGGRPLATCVCLVLPNVSNHFITPTHP